MVSNDFACQAAETSVRSLSQTECRPSAWTSLVNLPTIAVSCLLCILFVLRSRLWCSYLEALFTLIDLLDIEA